MAGVKIAGNPFLGYNGNDGRVLLAPPIAASRKTGLVHTPEKLERSGDMPKQVLVVADGGTMAETLRRMLPGQRYAVSTVDREQALGEVGDARPDLIVLDGSSAPNQALELGQLLCRQASGARVIALVPSADVASGQGGVTCYSRMPTEDDLVSWLGEEGKPKAARVLRVGNVALRLDTRQLEVNGDVSVLTPKQFRLLRLFMSHPGEVLTRKRLMKDVWETDYTGDTRTLDVHIHWVREKLGDVPGQPRYLQTVRRVGYRFVDPENPERGSAHGATR